jgi:hypothetical protein
MSLPIPPKSIFCAEQNGDWTYCRFWWFGYRVTTRAHFMSDNGIEVIKILALKRFWRYIGAA